MVLNDLRADRKLYAQIDSAQNYFGNYNLVYLICTHVIQKKIHKHDRIYLITGRRLIPETHLTSCSANCAVLN